MTLEQLYEHIPSIVSLLNAGVYTTLGFIFIKFVAPKLSKKQWADKNIAVLANIQPQIVELVQEMQKLYTTFRKDFIKIQRALDLMVTYSNLGDSPKTLVHAILEDSGVDVDSINNFSKETQQLIKETTEKVEKELATKAKSALEELAEELKEPEEV